MEEVLAVVDPHCRCWYRARPRDGALRGVASFRGVVYGEEEGSKFPVKSIHDGARQ